MKNYVMGIALVFSGAIVPHAYAEVATNVVQAAQDTTTPAPSTQSASPKAGDLVYDNAGQPLGSVDSLKGDVVVLTTDKGRGAVPLTAFSMGAKGLTINMTKADLEAAIVAAQSGRAPTP